MASNLALLFATGVGLLQLSMTARSSMAATLTAIPTAAGAGTR